MKLPWPVLLLLVATATEFSAQQNIDTGCPVTQKIQPDGTEQFIDCKGRTTTQALPAQPANAIARPAGEKPEVSLPVDSPAALAYQKYLAAYYDYETHSLDYAERVFNWQYKSSVAIFIVVILLVLAGLAFAGIQFAIAMKVHPTGVVKKRGATAGGGEGAATAALASTFEASSHGVKITSSVIGLLILVVSIGFFYLYLVYVYPIQNIAK
jgi:hypothetical protein